MTSAWGAGRPGYVTMPGSMTWLTSMNRVMEDTFAEWTGAARTQSPAAMPASTERRVRPQDFMCGSLRHRRGNNRGNAHLPEAADQAVEARLRVQARVVGIVHEPVALAAALRDHASEQVQRFVALPGASVHARDVHQRTGVVGIEIETAPRPLQGALRL